MKGTRKTPVNGAGMGQTRGRVPAADRHIGAAFRTEARDFRHLLAFVNHEGPWADLYPSFTVLADGRWQPVPVTDADLAARWRIDGARFTPADANALRDELRRTLAGLIDGHTPSNVGPYCEVPIACTWPDRVEVETSDLAHLLTWQVFELHRQRKDRLLARCESCQHFFLSKRPTKAHFCSTRCRQRAAEQRRKIQNREHARRWSRAATQTTARRPLPRR